MRNIFNLITDAFVRMGLNETDYKKSIHDTYIIDITDSRTPLLKATLYLDLTPNNEIYDVTYTNNLFEELAWARFCRVFTDEIPQDIEEMLLQNLINILR